MNDDDGEKLLHTVNGGARRLSVSRSTLYQLMAEGKIKFVLIGKRRHIPTSEIQRIAAEGVPDSAAAAK